METAIKNYIEERIPELAGRLYPLFTTDLEGIRIAYTSTPIAGGHLKQNQMEFKVIGMDYDETEDAKQKLITLLDKEEDEPFDLFQGIRFRCQVSGGGCLYQDGVDRYENTVLFLVDWRKING